MSTMTFFAANLERSDVHEIGKEPIRITTASLMLKNAAENASTKPTGWTLEYSPLIGGKDSKDWHAIAFFPAPFVTIKLDISIFGGKLRCTGMNEESKNAAYTVTVCGAHEAPAGEEDVDVFLGDITTEKVLRVAQTATELVHVSAFHIYSNLSWPLKSGFIACQVKAANGTWYTVSVMKATPHSTCDLYLEPGTEIQCVPTGVAKCPEALKWGYVGYWEVGMDVSDDDEESSEEEAEDEDEGVEVEEVTSDTAVGEGADSKIAAADAMEDGESESSSSDEEEEEMVDPINTAITKKLLNLANKATVTTSDSGSEDEEESEAEGEEDEEEASEGDEEEEEEDEEDDENQSDDQDSGVKIVEVPEKSEPVHVETQPLPSKKSSKNKKEVEVKKPEPVKEKASTPAKPEKKRKTPESEKSPEPPKKSAKQTGNDSEKASSNEKPSSELAEFTKTVVAYIKSQGDSVKIPSIGAKCKRPANLKGKLGVILKSIKELKVNGEQVSLA